ncbi:hypothetical protein QUH73_04305 [Labilibaculum sp. K2S]|uniref:hypothetical protein n=1 Tax=Labilibaculum sp. K2S TaxID=3056386 RepID=UPI0025A3A609|nr:hypothetical protein [Labilibaculum sp. K2S]MDM8159037.1 hypothetical protein [Labilibaculum sp. K2S]
MTTTEIKGFFSKEHSLIVFLICFCFIWLYKTDTTLRTILLQQAEIKADIKIITYKINNGKQDNAELLAEKDLSGRKRKSEFQKADFPGLNCFYTYWNDH